MDGKSFTASERRRTRGTEAWQEKNAQTPTEIMENTSARVFLVIRADGKYRGTRFLLVKHSKEPRRPAWKTHKMEEGRQIFSMFNRSATNFQGKKRDRFAYPENIRSQVFSVMHSAAYRKPKRRQGDA